MLFLNILVNVELLMDIKNVSIDELRFNLREVMEIKNLLEKKI